MATGLNNEIINYSKYFKYNYLFTLILVFVNLGLLWYFLTELNFGLEGVAYAISISIIIFNLIKVFFIYYKLNLNLLDKNYILLIAKMLAVFTVIYFIPFTSNILLNIVLKTILFYSTNILCVNHLKIVNVDKIRKIK
jgi:O-antigen/teichoic acid export membrane protein